MTVSSTTNLVSYAGDDLTDVFAYPCKVFAETDLLVVLKDDTTGVETELTLTTDYSVSDVGAEAGGNVTMGTAPATGKTLVIKRVLPLTQGTDLVANDALPAETLEEGLDRQTMIAQQLQEEIDRCFKGQVSTDWSGISLTVPDPEAGKALGWNAAGDGLANLSDMSGVNVSSWAETFLAALTSAAARTTLAVYSQAEVDALISKLAGYRDGLIIAYKDTGTITVGGGDLIINGSIARLIDATDLTITTTAGALHVEHIFAEDDDGDIVLSHSPTAPTQDHSKGGGWYDATGDLRCIGAILVDASNHVIPQYRIGREMVLMTRQTLVSASSGNPTTMIALSTGVPNLDRCKVRLHCGVSHASTAYVVLYIADGDNADSKSITLGAVEQSVANNTAPVYVEAHTNTSGQIRWAAESATCVVSMILCGFTLPEGI